jgi:Zn-dependent protease
MLNLLFSSPLSFVFFAIGLIIAVTIHEFAHAFTADHLGDPTPRSQDRVSLNPLKHLDPLGSLMLLLIGFGWGKPVPFDPYNLENPRRDAALISLAGPASNIILAILISLAIKFFLPSGFYSLFYPLIYINIVLAIFNLIPIHPLDGQKILTGILPKHLSLEYDLIMHRYGTIILIFMILPIFGSSPASMLISPIIQFITNILI